MTNHDKELKTLLKDVIKKKVTMDEERTNRNRDIADDLINNLIDQMKNICPLFDKLYQNKIIYTGSYYSGLRVGQPTEFDLNMVLQLPFDRVDLTLTPHEKFLNFVNCNVSHDGFSNDLMVKKILSEFFDEEHYLLKPSIHQWIQSLIDKARNTKYFQNYLQSKKLKIRRKISGPAFIIKVFVHKPDDVISVDLVPVIDGSNLPFPRQVTMEKFRKMNKEAKEFVLVPVPLAGKHGWAISFPEAEKYLLYKLGCVKLLIRLFKLNRDIKTNLACISSYIVKCIFTMEIFKHGESDYWDEDNMGRLFIKMLHMFEDAFRSNYIPFAFIPGANLIKSNPTKYGNIANYYRNNWKRIERDPSNVNKMFENKK